MPTVASKSLRSSSTLDPATQAWIAAVGSSNVSTPRAALVDAMIVGLKADGVWTKLDRLWLFAAENTASALVDMVADTTATPTLGPVFTADRGYAGNGLNAYIDSNLPNNFGTGNFQRNAACYFGWSNTAGMDGGGLFGTFLGTKSQLFPLFTDGTTYGCINSGVWDFAYAGTGETGLYLMNRTGSLDSTLDVNGVQTAVNSTNASTAQSVVPFDALYANAGDQYSSRQCSALGLGGALTPTERVAVYTRTRAYMTAVGVS